jgi:calpain
MRLHAHQQGGNAGMMRKRHLKKTRAIVPIEVLPPPPSDGNGEAVSGYVTQEEKDLAVFERATVKFAQFIKSMEEIGVAPEKFFKRSDENVDKNLSPEEFRNSMLKLNAGLDLHEIQTMFDNLDRNSSNTLDMKEFMRLITEQVNFMKSEEQEAAKSLLVPKTLLISTSSPSEPVLPAVPPRRSDRRQQTVKLLQDLNLSVEKLDNQIDEIMGKMEITEEDRFMGRPSIFNSPLIAAKYCYDVVKKLKEKPEGKRMFDDPDFGPNETDPRGYSSICLEKEFKGAPIKELVIWPRMNEISVEEGAEFIIDGATSNDVNQGKIGDCWLIGAMNILAQHDIYLRGNYKPPADPSTMNEISNEEVMQMNSGLYPPIFHHFKKYGIFVIRFFKNFAWRYVVIDDKLPCHKNYSTNENELIFGCCSNEKEFWVPLVEKAYAKLHGSYQALISGDLSDALVDFTGLVSQRFPIKIEGSLNKILRDPDYLWNKLLNMLRHGALMGASITGKIVEGPLIIKGKDTGLLCSHAYSIQGFYEVTKTDNTKVRLVRLRNPWGSKRAEEWNGKWSDDSTEMIDEWENINKAIDEEDGDEAEKINPELMKDGTFFMSFEDFMELFTRMSICIKFPKRYTGRRFYNEWKGPTAGGTPLTKKPKETQMNLWRGNTQYLIEVNKPTHVFISIAQEDGRLRACGKDIYPFGTVTYFAQIMIVPSPDGQKVANFDNLLGASGFVLHRENYLDIVLQPGAYCIIPCTKNPGEQGKYFLSIYYAAEEDSRQEQSANKADAKEKAEKADKDSTSASPVVRLENLTDKSQPHIIEEEEETVREYPEQLKKMLKYKILESIS